jgi:hypothetical protein
MRNDLLNLEQAAEYLETCCLVIAIKHFFEHLV